MKNCLQLYIYFYGVKKQHNSSVLLIKLLWIDWFEFRVLWFNKYVFVFLVEILLHKVNACDSWKSYSLITMVFFVAKIIAQT